MQPHARPRTKPCSNYITANVSKTEMLAPP